MVINTFSFYDILGSCKTFLMLFVWCWTLFGVYYFFTSFRWFYNFDNLFYFYSLSRSSVLEPLISFCHHTVLFFFVTILFYQHIFPVINTIVYFNVLHESLIFWFSHCLFLANASSISSWYFRFISDLLILAFVISSTSLCLYVLASLICNCFY